MHRPQDTAPRLRRAKRLRPTLRPRAPARRGDAASADGIHVFTRAAARRVDELCTSRFGIPSLLLMEHASLVLAAVARAMLEGRRSSSVLILAGPGNNGGDGFALARHLLADGYDVRIVLAAPASLRARGMPGGAGAGMCPPDAAVNLDIARRLRIPIARAPARATPAFLRRFHPALIVDALLGTGLSRGLTGPIAHLIQSCNALRRSGVPVLAVDVPSGLDADTGEPAPIISRGRSRPGPAVVADVTVALLGLKPGYLALAARPFLGDCLVADIGAPRELIRELGTPLSAAALPGHGDRVIGPIHSPRRGARPRRPTA